MNEQLDMLKNTVKSSVEDAVKAEFQSYSAVLHKNSNPFKNNVSTENLKEAVKTVVQEEDCSKNLMIFGQPENRGEDLNTITVEELFQAIREKPKSEACRVGQKKTDKNSTTRPVKVTAVSFDNPQKLTSEVLNENTVVKAEWLFTVIHLLIHCCFTGPVFLTVQ